MAANSTLIDFRDCRLLTAHFELNRDFAPGPEVQLTTNLSFSHNCFKDDQGSPCLRLFMKILIQGEAAPLRAEVEMGGLFGLSSQPSDAVELSRVAEINCAAIMFPYLRESLADLTRRAGLAPLHLPPINFVEFYKQNHPEK